MIEQPQKAKFGWCMFGTHSRCPAKMRSAGLDRTLLCPCSCHSEEES